jgi:hypothetical protein
VRAVFFAVVTFVVRLFITEPIGVVPDLASHNQQREDAISRKQRESLPTVHEKATQLGKDELWIGYVPVRVGASELKEVERVMLRCTGSKL